MVSVAPRNEAARTYGGRKARTTSAERVAMMDAWAMMLPLLLLRLLQLLLSLLLQLVVVRLVM